MKTIVAGDDPGMLGVKDMSKVSTEVLELCSTTSKVSSDNSDESSVTSSMTSSVTSSLTAPSAKQPVIQQNAAISPEIERGPPPNVVS